MIVEWNAHMFSRDQTRFPFHPQAVYTPDPARLDDDPLPAYLTRMQGVGIDRAVLVQPEPYGDDHRLVLDCLRREPTRLKATALFYPKDPDAPSKLADLVAQHARIVALRFHAHRGKEGYLDSFYDASVRQLWQQAGELGLAIELHIGPNYARQVADLLDDYPDFPVLIDHVGEPAFGTELEYQDVLALGRYRNVTIKLSGLGHFAHAPGTWTDPRILAARLAAAFGPAQLAWSDGLPGLVDDLFPQWSDAQLAQVKGGNLAQMAGFAP